MNPKTIINKDYALFKQSDGMALLGHDCRGKNNHIGWSQVYITITKKTHFCGGCRTVTPKEVVSKARLLGMNEITY